MTTLTISGPRLHQGLRAHVQSRAVLLRVLDSGAPKEAVVVAVEADVALVLAVLRLAREQNPHCDGDCAGVAHALELLELRELEGLAREIAVFDPLQGGPGNSAMCSAFRLHAAAVRSAALRVAPATAWNGGDELVAAALLHDVGKLELAHPDGSYPGPDGAADTPERRLEHERARLGSDHAVAGARLAREWNLPNRIVEAIEHHHSPSAEGAAAVVRLADLLVHYSQGHPVELEEIMSASSAVSLDRDSLGPLLYELATPFDSGEERPGSCPLSEREHEILSHLARGKVYKQIASELGITTSTVRAHLHRVYGKLGTADRAQAVLAATDKGWI